MVHDASDDLKFRVGLITKVGFPDGVSAVIAPKGEAQSKALAARVDVPGKPGKSDADDDGDAGPVAPTPPVT